MVRLSRSGEQVSRSMSNLHVLTYSTHGHLLTLQYPLRHRSGAVRRPGAQT